MVNELNKLSSDEKIALVLRLQEEWGLVAILRESCTVPVVYFYDADIGEGRYYIDAGRTR